MAPSVASSTREERLAFVRQRYRCIADCDQCGLCQLFHGRDAEQALAAYIEGRSELAVLLRELRGR